MTPIDLQGLYMFTLLIYMFTLLKWHFYRTFAIPDIVKELKAHMDTQIFANFLNFSTCHMLHSFQVAHKVAVQTVMPPSVPQKVT